MGFFGSKGISIKTYVCPKCGKKYEDPEQGHFPGKPCKECTELMRILNAYERRLPAEKSPNKAKKISREIAKLRKRLRM